jgi:prepilin-type N-terminal cleavage/methylation domain-containing protein
MYNQRMKTRKGFTLIELLVVIAIIGLISSVVLASLAKARSKGRDARRIADIHQLMIALEIYNDAVGHYPYSASCGATHPDNTWCNSSESLGANGRWIKDNGTANVLAIYIPNEPKDPTPKAPTTFVGPDSPGVYYYYGDTAANFKGVYLLTFTLENSPHPLESVDGVTDCIGFRRDYGAADSVPGLITLGASCAK